MHAMQLEVFMKHKFFVFLFCISLSYCISGRAEEKNVLFSKSHDSSFLKARGTSFITLPGDPNAAFQELSFRKSIETIGDGIKVKNAHSFSVEKGSYLITFSGTFEALGPDPLVQIQMAFKKGSQVQQVQTESFLLIFNPFSTKTISALLKVNKKTTISVVVRNIVTNTSVRARIRALTISKVDD